MYFEPIFINYTCCTLFNGDCRIKSFLFLKILLKSLYIYREQLDKILHYYREHKCCKQGGGTVGSEKLLLNQSSWKYEKKRSLILYNLLWSK